MPPEECGGPRGYMRILDQHKYYPPMAEQELVEKALQRIAGVLPDRGHRDSMATTAYLRVSTGTQGPPSSCKSRSQRRPSSRLSASVSYHLPLYRGKTVTPTPLKDIFTPIWAGPYSRAHRQTRNGAAMESMLRPNLPTWRPYLASIRIPAKNSANASWPWSGSTCETYWSGRTTTMQPVSRFTPRSSKMSPAFGSTQNIFS
jgi:hypothetical protein